MIKNATLYRIQRGWNPALAAMEEALAAGAFTPCGPTNEKAKGWMPPRGHKHGALVESVNDWRILRFVIETKSVPGSAVREAAQTKARQIEATTGRKPGKKETKELREDARLELLPHAFPRQSRLWVFLNLEQGWLVTDAATQGKSDEVITALVCAFNDLAISLLTTNVTPQTAMTQWLLADTAFCWPEGFCVERTCELRSNGEEKAVVRFDRHHLLTDEIRKHISEGKLPTRLAMSWEGRVGFVLDSSMHLRKIQFLEGVFDGHSDSADEDHFDTGVTLTTGELGRMVPALIEALGCELTGAAL